MLQQYQLLQASNSVQLRLYNDCIEIQQNKMNKVIRFYDSQYSIYWDKDNDDNYIGFTLLKNDKKTIQYMGLKNEVTGLRSILKGKMAFYQWNKEYQFIKWIKKNDHCEIFQVLRGENFSAIKVLDDNNYQLELSINKKLLENPHPNILIMNEFYKDEIKSYMVMDYIENNLYSLSKQNSCIQLQKIRIIMQQILEGLNHIHQLNIIHRDLKFDNILVDNNQKIKIIDFGLACYGPYTNIRSGTAGYIAPEVFKSQKITSKSDIYSVGVIFHKLLTGRGIYTNLQHNIQGDGEISYNQDENARDLLDNMLIRDSNLRYSAEDCLAHPFFIGEDDHQASTIITKLSPKTQVKFQSTQFISITI